MTTEENNKKPREEDAVDQKKRKSNESEKNEIGAQKEGAGDIKSDKRAKSKKERPNMQDKEGPMKQKRPGKKTDVEEHKEEESPSPKEPLLKKYVALIHEHLGENSLEDAYINRASKELPTLIVQPESYFSIARLLKTHQELQFNYLSELHGTDFKEYMEVYVHLYSFARKEHIALKVKLDREKPIIHSLVPLWEGANWPECEAYDLLGIEFKNHPDLKRIFLGEDWEGYPLRKDYEPYDVEV
ncbi:NADH/F420H2 dehydrogenase subunit C [Melghiribacillus thermohalophilus]|uniref:NAD(P)H dehydrogenase subunit J n=1 Tax=Melghiribacillus thermohalophilus TaxID=1324956 RepID=A0A4R3NCE3_9BACI|nr:NADH-quinone oxidoreductase subunit C [Melghiribacillus thermohalophilus]TCT26415.1 NADH/F420H2 dehydrogenase subunit C [Melghiribacillus thermohalophilus]